MSEQPPATSAWLTDTIRSVVDPKRPITYGVVQPGTRLEQGIPLIRGQDYSRGFVDDSGLYLIHPNISAAYTRSTVKGGDILFSIVGYLGQTAIVPENLNGANITQTTARIAIKSPHHNRYFLQQFRSQEFSAEVRKYQKGSAQPGLNLTDVEKMAVVVPPPETQKSIAAALDTADEAIAKTEALIAKQRHVHIGLLHDLFSRGLDSNGQLRDPIAHPEDFQDSPLGLVPRGWVVAPLGHFLASVEYGISTSLSSEGNLPVLRMNNLAGGEADLGDLKFATSDVPTSLLLRPGDVLFNRTNSYEHVGRTGIWRNQISVATFASYLVRLNPEINRLSSDFLNLLLNLPETQQRLRRYATPAVQQVNINPSQLQLMIVAVPEHLPEQDRIALIANHSAQSLRAAVDEQAKLVALKSGLMTDLLTGRVRVPKTPRATP